MGWKQWSLVAVLIGGGILLQIPGHDVMQMEHEAVARDDLPPSMVDPLPPFQTMALEVTGMT